MTNKKNLALFALAAALITGVAVWAALRPMSGPAPRERLTILGADRLAFALLYVAQAKGYFREEGLEVSFLRPQQGTNAIRTLADEKADLATVFETPVIERSLAGHPPSIVTTLSSSKRNAGLLALTAVWLNGRLAGIWMKPNEKAENWRRPLNSCNRLSIPKLRS